MKDGVHGFKMGRTSDAGTEFVSLNFESAGISDGLYNGSDGGQGGGAGVHRGLKRPAGRSKRRKS